MKHVLVIMLLVWAGAVEALTIHRSFRNGYPVGVTMRTQSNVAVLTAPKVAGKKSTVVTNRVVLTKEQLEKLLKSKKINRKKSK